MGLPYLVLSTTSPLAQRWFAQDNPGKSPYRLFALSNLASLLSLLGYPFAIEPWLPGSLQARLWSAAYGLFVLLYGALAVRSLRGRAEAASGGPAPEGDGPAPTPTDQLFWVALAAASSALPIGVTNHLTQDIPSIPLLWVVPLSLYLATFILCFDSSRWYLRPLFLGLAAAVLALMAWFLADARLQLVAERLQIANVVDDDQGTTATDWVLLSEGREVLDDEDVLEKTRSIKTSKKWPLWTDDYSNLLQIFRLR